MSLQARFSSCILAMANFLAPPSEKSSISSEKSFFNPMKISECSYCGTLAITDNDVCSSCQLMIAPETPADAPYAVNSEAGSFQPHAQVVATSGYPAPPNVESAPPAPRPFPGLYQSTQPVLDSKCVKCRTPLPRGQRICFDCENKKSSPWKKLAFLLIFVVAAGFFSFDYVYEQVSPHGTFRKYAKATGADDSLVYENFVLTGETVLSVNAPMGFKATVNSADGSSSETFAFKMLFKKPNLSGVEFMNGEAGSNTVFKQVFDGTRGWKYSNMPGQTASYQDTEEGFGSKKMGLGMDDYDSLEFAGETIAQDYGKDYIKRLTDIKEIEIADIKKPTGEKTILLGKQKLNGKIESSLLVFDRNTGMLLGMLKKGVMGNTPVMTIIYSDKYVKFPVKRKGWFGVSETPVLVPTKMSFVTTAGMTGQLNGVPTITIQLNVKAVETDAKIEDKYFQKP